jgi:hypothetical protein
MSRSWVMMVMLLLLLMGGTVAVWFHFEGRRANPAIQRLEGRRILEAYAAAYRAYAAAHAAAPWPKDLRELWDWPGFSTAADMPVPDRVTRARQVIRVEGAGLRFVYRPPPPGVPAGTVVVASAKPFAAVARGEPFGAQGERADRDIPAVYYAIDDTLGVVELDEAAWRMLAPWAATVP